MKIKGEYRDVLSSNGTVIKDTGWKSNDIVEDYGRFLAALMKKYFKGLVGIDYMAVGSGSGKDYTVFKDKVEKFFKECNNNNSGPYSPDGDYWVWAKKIDVDAIKYLNPEGEEVDTVTNRLKIEVIIEEAEPKPGETFDFKEFALLGIDEKEGKFDPNKMFFINYVDHELIKKDKKMELTRTVILKFPLTFPLEEKGEEVL